MAEIPLDVAFTYLLIVANHTDCVYYLLEIVHQRRGFTTASPSHHQHPT
jgi:hypothetical protein